MRIILPLLAVSLLSIPASAEVFSGRGGLNFSLTSASPSSKETADLQITPFGIAAKNGTTIKRASREGDFAHAEVTVFGEPYDVKEANGSKWRMWVRSADDKAVVVELLRARKVLVTDRVFQAAGVTIDGERSDPNFSQLTLYSDGTYRYGDLLGRYTSDEGGITLSGTPGQWGRATYTVDGDSLTFRFHRGLLSFEVLYAPQATVVSAL